MKRNRRNSSVDEDRLHAAFMPAIYAERTEALDNEVHDFAHFRAVGLRSNISPSVYFDPDHYRTQLSSEPPTSLLAHFIETGAAEGLNPHPLVDTAFTMRGADIDDPRDLLGFLASPASRRIRIHPLFWSGYYLDISPDIADRIGHPLHHYLNVGHRRRKTPNPFFAPEHYAIHLDDDWTRSPLEHWVTVGRGRNLIPTPLFDPDHYRSQVSVDGSDAHVYLHFLRHGLWEDLSPHPLFDSSWYRERYSDVPADEPAILHYLRHEHQRAHQPGPKFDPATLPRIVVHDNHDYGGRILERYLSRGVTAVHVAPPLVLSDALVAQVHDASELLPRATAPYLHALETDGAVRQNFNDHDTRRTLAARSLSAASDRAGGIVVMVGKTTAESAGIVEALTAAARALGTTADVIVTDELDVEAGMISLDSVLHEADPSAADRDLILSEWLIATGTAAFVGVDSDVFSSILRTFGEALRQITSLGVFTTSDSDLTTLPPMLDVLDGIAHAGSAARDDLVADLALPRRRHPLLVDVGTGAPNVSGLLDQLTDSAIPDGVMKRFELR